MEQLAPVHSKGLSQHSVGSKAPAQGKAKATESPQLSCCYINNQAVLEVVRLVQGIQLVRERVLWPGQRFQFLAHAESHLEISSGQWAATLMADRIACERLRVGT